MTGRSDVIIISSSPPSLPAEPRATYDIAGAFIVPPQPPSPSTLPPSISKASSRSHYFSATASENPIGKRQISKKSSAEEPISNEAPTKPRKRAQKTVKESTTTPKSLETGSLASRDNAAEKKTTKPRKPRPTKKKEANSGTQDGNVSNNDQPAKKSKKAVKRDEPENAGKKDSKQSSALRKNEDLQLDKSTTRRLDWTPPKDPTSNGVVMMNDQPDAEGETLGRFGKLMSGYNFSGLASDPHQISLNIESTGPTQRRRIELVDHPVQPQLKETSETNDAVGPSTSIAQIQPTIKLKRFSTLTARMTAMYASTDIKDDDPSGDSQSATDDKTKRKIKSRKRELVSTVLAPEDVFKTLDEQDLVFGTCSQLEMNDSLETLRETQQAIRSSESLALQERERNVSSEPTRSHESISARIESYANGTRNLWNVAARDTDGSLRQTEELEIVDLTKTPPPAKQKVGTTTILTTSNTFIAPRNVDLFDAEVEKPTYPTKKNPAPTADEQQIPNSEPAISTETSEKTLVPVTISQEVDFECSSRHPYNGLSDADLLKHISAYGFKPVKGRKKMIELLEMCWESIQQSKKNTPVPESQPQAENVQTETSARVPAPRAKSTATTKKDKKGQGSSQTSNWHKALKPPYPPISTDLDIDIEIQDSEEDVIPSRVQHLDNESLSNKSNSGRQPSLDILPKPIPSIPTKRKNAPSKTLRSKKDAKLASSNSTVKSSNPSSTKKINLPDILVQISKAVLPSSGISAPSVSSGGRGNPTWHEKILMYDAIVLEDLTTWLNVEGLGLVGEDREVSTAIVREWCESKGICCCWKNSNW
ncbi:hypothetical protein N7495_003191 [Penicillium taxi]|uniref:uncharacterized protein n=1 Tax=Penicillium taxi TaxID=168475 RepID=UPI002544D4C1|nr:uncharacterized protein N7495_003191 [Penicillium taxi]KAJ5902663.1 hypothetical protein N7495_003191 [Penicillium taxi]